ncbi:hypothetical protein [Paucisalibacillus sp. EB02]|uniref:hypothetical protein n=1 Tax=Paucisalibacillus sp. EB02 TaxID=1347087 RepID=UPI0005A8627A|nr:hypothetical protein [Paucisalibacillus sp. EB02]
MSENRRVIRVKDLVIEAENVIINPRRKNYDPIIGGIRDEEDRWESSSSSSRESESSDKNNDKRDRGPFSWI